MAKNKQLIKTIPGEKLPVATNPDGVKSVYCNNMEVTISVFDARMMFNEVLRDRSGFTVVRRADIVMSIPHLQAMMQAIQTQMATLKTQLEEMKAKQAAKQ
jgi:hypothetical protein